MAKANYRKAFELGNKVSEIEKLRIASHYDQFIGNTADAIHDYSVWAQIYPQDWVPQSNLANLYTDVAKYPEAIEAGKAALRLNPSHANPYVVLARAYKRSTRFADAKAICRQAISKRLDGLSTHNLMYEIAFAERDAATMAEQVPPEKDGPNAASMLDYQGLAAATEGKVHMANALFAQAIEAAREQGPDHAEEASGIFTDNILMLADLGLDGDARRLALEATGLDTNEDAPFALAEAGDAGRATALSVALAKTLSRKHDDKWGFRAFGSGRGRRRPEAARRRFACPSTGASFRIAGFRNALFDGAGLPCRKSAGERRDSIPEDSRQSRRRWRLAAVSAGLSWLGTRASDAGQARGEPRRVSSTLRILEGRRRGFAGSAGCPARVRAAAVRPEGRRPSSRQLTRDNGRPGAPGMQAELQADAALYSRNHADFATPLLTPSAAKYADNVLAIRAVLQ